MVGIVGLHLPFRDAASPVFEAAYRQRRRKPLRARRRARKTEKPRSAQGRGSTFSVTEDHDPATFGVAAVMPSHPTVRCQRQRLSFIHRGPGCPAIPPKELVFQRFICRTAVPTGEVHRLPQKVRVFIGAVAQSQGRLPQNPAKLQYARALPRYTSRNLKMEMDILNSYCKHFCRRHSVLRTKCRQAESKGRPERPS
jgi:hypothetical protein